jgi:hypothetical protein
VFSLKMRLEKGLAKCLHCETINDSRICYENTPQDKQPFRSFRPSLRDGRVIAQYWRKTAIASAEHEFTTLHTHQGPDNGPATTESLGIHLFLLKGT